MNNSNDLEKKRNMWKNIEEYLTTIPNVVLWILLVSALFVPGSIGGVILFITFVLMYFNKSDKENKNENP